MYAHIKTKLASCVLVLTFGTLVGTVHAAGRNPAPRPTLLVADQSDSRVTIDCPGCDDPFEIWLVTLADIRDTAAESDPDGPQRIATDIYHPHTGELIHINIVEVVIRHLPARSGARARVEIIPNREPAYCRLCDLDALCDDRPIDTSDGGSGLTSKGDGTYCAICQEQVIEVFVGVDADVRRHQGPASYGVKVFTVYSGSSHGDGDPDDPPPPDGEGDTLGELDEGGNPGGSPDSNSSDDGGNPGG